MPLLKTKNNVIGLPAMAVTERVNIDSLRAVGTYPYDDSKGGGTFPDGVAFPVSITVSAGGDTQTLTDNGSSTFTRNFGLEWWDDWA